MPVPAAPAPASTIRAPRSCWPETRSEDRIAATAIAAVPWMSSLNEQIQLR